MRKTLKIKVTGRVQGVGFRPFIYLLSKKYNLTGTVQNNMDSLVIIAEGHPADLSQMIQELKITPPPLSKINEITFNQISCVHFNEFTIIPSQADGDTMLWIAADAAVCALCLKEMLDPHNRRFQYPFINCTQCGPRYTIITGLPYDRPKTTMKKFNMCPLCQKEYEDPLNRRHHAQPICCPKCGPVTALYNEKGELEIKNQEAINQTAHLFKQGKIIGIKGIGGFHLACDAYQEDVIEQLRSRKKRPQRPFAIMAKSLEAARNLCYISEQEADSLTSLQMPVVILQKKKDCRLPKNISPGLSTLGIMLPYTPLHYLLFEQSGLEYMVMTSANPSGHPIQYKSEFEDHPQHLWDYVLTNNRDIYLPVDDSVVQCIEKKVIYLRRGRGFVPEPIKTNYNVDRIIALGANQKNTFAVGRQNQIIMSPHIGDLENEEMIQFFEKQLHHVQNWLGIEGKHIAVDKHPLYASSTIAKKIEGEIISVQHHHAHLVSCMEDNGLEEPCLGIILDGTGYGIDGHIWGFEFLYGHAGFVERLAHLSYTPLPGGEKAVTEPWRNAVGMILYYWPEKGKELAQELFPEKAKEIEIIESMITNRINTPMAGTCGRLFDAVSAILGICLTSSYEGEAAMKLADYMNRSPIESPDKIYSFRLNTNHKDQLQFDLFPMIEQIIQDRLNKQPLTNIIHTFHKTIVSGCVQTVLALVEKRPDLNRTVVLSGGSFQNVYLAREIQKSLQEEGFAVYSHKKVPCHDGGLSLGQIVIAAHAVSKNPVNERRDKNVSGGSS